MIRAVLNLRIGPVKQDPKRTDYHENEVASLRPNRAARQPIGTVQAGVERVSGQNRPTLRNGVEIALAPIPRHVKADGPPQAPPPAQRNTYNTPNQSPPPQPTL